MHSVSNFFRYLFANKHIYIYIYIYNRKIRLCGYRFWTDLVNSCSNLAYFGGSLNTFLKKDSFKKSKFLIKTPFA